MSQHSLWMPVTMRYNAGSNPHLSAKHQSENIRKCLGFFYFSVTYVHFVSWKYPKGTGTIHEFYDGKTGSIISFIIFPS